MVVPSSAYSCFGVAEWGQQAGLWAGKQGLDTALFLDPSLIPGLLTSVTVISDVNTSRPITAAVLPGVSFPLPWGSAAPATNLLWIQCRHIAYYSTS